MKIAFCIIDGFDDFFDGDGMASEKKNERLMMDLVVSVSQISVSNHF